MEKGLVNMQDSYMTYGFMIINWYNMRMFFLFAFLSLSLHIQATEGNAIKLEFGDTSLIIELNKNPRIDIEDGNVILKNNETTIITTYPCTVTIINCSVGTSFDTVKIRNNNQNLINVYSIDGKKIAILKDLHEKVSLQRGLYIINGKKILIR